MIDLDALEQRPANIICRITREERDALVRAVRCADAVYQSDGRSLPEMRALGAALASFRNE